MTRSNRKPGARGVLCAGLLLTLASTALAGPDIGVKVKGDLLILDGARNNQLAVTIVPLRDGMRIVPGANTTLNRKDAAVTLGRVPRNWVFRFGQAAGVEIRILPPADGVPTLRPRTVAFIGARTTNRFFMDGLAIRRDLKLDLRRARDTLNTEIRLERSTIAGRLQVRQGRFSADITCEDLVVGKFAKLAHKRQRRTNGTQATYVFTRCELASLDVKVPIASALVEMNDTNVSGDVSLRGDAAATLTDVRIGGDLEMRTGANAQTVALTGVMVARETFLSLGDDDDVVTIADSSFGGLFIRGSSGSDTLTTIRVSVGSDSLFDGGPGDVDRWFTSDDLLLHTNSVEEIGPPPVQ